MPAYDDLAQIRIAHGREHARFPLATLQAFGGVSFEDGTGTAFRRFAVNASDLWGQFSDQLAAAAVNLSWDFVDDAVPISAEQEVRSFNEAQFRFTIAGARDDGSDLVLEIKCQFVSNNPQTGRYTAFQVKGYSDNHGSDVGAAGLNGRRVKAEARNFDGSGTYAEFLPTKPTFQPRDLWVRRGDLVGDFSTIAVTSDLDLQTVARRTVTLMAAYDPILEDLDTQIVYGADDDGVPIIWRLDSTTRGERDIQLNLVADIV